MGTGNVDRMKHFLNEIIQWTVSVRFAVSFKYDLILPPPVQSHINVLDSSQ